MLEKVLHQPIKPIMTYLTPIYPQWSLSFKNIKGMRVFRVAVNCYDSDIWVLGKVFLTSWPLWAKLAQNFTSLPAIKPAAQRFLHKVFVRFSHESHAHEGWLPQRWIYAQICWGNDVKDKTVNGRTDIKPTLTWWAASECVVKKTPARRTGVDRPKCVSRFTEFSHGKERSLCSASNCFPFSHKPHESIRVTQL